MNEYYDIIIDPGHGGKDSGAVGPTGEMEKVHALAVSNRLCNLLHNKGVRTLLTRNDDRFLTLSERAAIANLHGAPLLSIHCNAGGGSGFEAFTTPGATKSDPWATHLLESYGRAFPNERLRADLRDGDPDKEARFTVLTKTRGPAVLFELGFIDTRAGEAFMDNPSNQIRMAAALAEGTIDWLAETTGFQKPKLVTEAVMPSAPMEEPLEKATAYDEEMAKPSWQQLAKISEAKLDKVSALAVEILELIES